MMQDLSNTPDALEVAEDEAIAWLVRMRGEDADRLRPEFSAWAAISPVNRTAYAWAQRHFSEAQGLKQSVRHGTAKRRAFTWPSTLAFAASVTLVVGLSLEAFIHQKPESAQTILALSTGPGEIRDFRLSDGSTVTLDANSRAQVEIQDGRRMMTLHEGRARLTIAAGRSPFEVSAGDGRIRSDRGIFDVAYPDGRSISVSMISGRGVMWARSQDAALAQPRQLIAGQTLQYTATRFLSFDADQANRRDWRSGWVEYRSISLRELVAQANRYAQRPIIIDDTEISDMATSGRFRLTNTASFVDRLAQVFDLSVTEAKDGTHLRKKISATD